VKKFCCPQQAWLAGARVAYTRWDRHQYLIDCLPRVSADHSRDFIVDSLNAAIKLLQPRCPISRYSQLTHSWQSHPFKSPLRMGIWIWKLSELLYNTPIQYTVPWVHPESTNLNGISIGSAVLQGSRSWQTDRVRLRHPFKPGSNLPMEPAGKTGWFFSYILNHKTLPLPKHYWHLRLLFRISLTRWQIPPKTGRIPDAEVAGLRPGGIRLKFRGRRAAIRGRSAATRRPWASSFKFCSKWV